MSSNKKKSTSTKTKEERTEPITVENVIKEIPLKLLKQIAEEKRLVVKGVRPSTPVDESQSKHLDAIAEQMHKLGLKEFVNSLTTSMVEIFTKHLPKNYLSTKGKNSTTGVVLKKRCYEKMIELTVRGYLDEIKDINVFIQLLDSIDMEPSSKDREVLIELICEEIETVCLSCFLEGLNLKTLRRMLDFMFLTVESDSKPIIVKSMITGDHFFQPDESSDAENKDLNISKKKPTEISESCTTSDLNYYFTVNELREFLKDNKLITAGRKLALIKRIKEFFEDKEAAIQKYQVDKRKENRKNRKNRGGGRPKKLVENEGEDDDKSEEKSTKSGSGKKKVAESESEKSAKSGKGKNKKENSESEKSGKSAKSGKGKKKNENSDEESEKSLKKSKNKKEENSFEEDSQKDTEIEIEKKEGKKNNKKVVGKKTTDKKDKEVSFDSLDDDDVNVKKGPVEKNVKSPIKRVAKNHRKSIAEDMDDLAGSLGEANISEKEEKSNSFDDE